MFSLCRCLKVPMRNGSFGRRQHLLAKCATSRPGPITLVGRFSTCSSVHSIHAQQSATDAIQQEEDPVRLRFAPSPTGSLHLGGLRTALFNHLLASNLGGKWILRIEDTDRTRYVPGALEELLHCLKWSGLNYDEGPDIGGPYGPYIQSERRSIYEEKIEHLLGNDHAYRCFCPTERLEALRLEARRTKSPTHYDGHCRHLSDAETSQRLSRGDKHVLRFRNRDLPKDSVDLVYGALTFAKLPQEDFILVKSDGMPTYHFANVVDDHAMRISHVLRGEEWIPSIPKHLALYSAFGWQAPSFAHMPILVNPDGSKLSKRSGDVKVSDYISKGYEPEALANFVALMGSSWSKTSAGLASSDFMTMEDMVASFSLSNLNKHRSTMFGGKLAYLNKEHVRKKVIYPGRSAELVDRAKSAVSSTLKIAPEQLSDEKIQKALAIAMVGKVTLGADLELTAQHTQERIDVVSELPSVYPYFFVKPDLHATEAAAMRSKIPNTELEGILSEASKALEASQESWTVETIKIALDSAASSADKKGAKFMTPLRYALTGQKSGPGIASLMHLLGKEESLSRLRTATQYGES